MIENDDASLQSENEGATTGNMLITNEAFANSTAPKNFANSMKELPSKRQRKKARVDESSES